MRSISFRTIRWKDNLAPDLCLLSSLLLSSLLSLSLSSGSLSIVDHLLPLIAFPHSSPNTFSAYWSPLTRNCESENSDDDDIKQKLRKYNFENTVGQVESNQRHLLIPKSAALEVCRSKRHKGAGSVTMPINVFLSLLYS